MITLGSSVSEIDEAGKTASGKLSKDCSFTNLEAVKQITDIGEEKNKSIIQVAIGAGKEITMDEFYQKSRDEDNSLKDYLFFKTSGNKGVCVQTTDWCNYNAFNFNNNIFAIVCRSDKHGPLEATRMFAKLKGMDSIVKSLALKPEPVNQ